MPGPKTDRVKCLFYSSLELLNSTRARGRREFPTGEKSRKSRPFDTYNNKFKEGKSDGVRPLKGGIEPTFATDGNADPVGVYEGALPDVVTDSASLERWSAD